MNAIENLHFIRPAWLLLLPMAVAVWWLWRRAIDPMRGWRAAIEPEFLSALTVGETSTSRWADTVWLIGWLISGIAIAGPTWRAEPSPFADDPVAVMLLVKTGESMNLSDLAPSRMERARLKVTDFTVARPGQPLGLVAFAGSPHLVLPPTRDTSVVATMASELSPEIMPKPGDDLAAALRLAARTLGDEVGVIVVVVDTVPRDQFGALKAFRADHRHAVHFLAIQREDTPELDAIREAARVLSASVTVMTADDADTESLVRLTAKSSQYVATTGEGTQWAEAGYWLMPVIAGIALLGFRRETKEKTGSAS